MLGSYQVRPYALGDEEQIVPLLTQVFPEWAKRKDPFTYWRWKYADAPLGFLIVVATKDEKIVSVVNNITLNLKMIDSTILSQYGDDYATHPDHRRRGLYRELSDFNKVIQDKMGVRLTYSVPVHPAVNRLSRDYQRFFTHSILHMMRVKDYELYLKNKSIKYSSTVGFSLKLYTAISKARRIRSQAPELKGEFKVDEIEKFDKKQDEFYEKVKENHSFLTERTSSYLNWRFRDPRAGDYTVIQASCGGEVIGYTILELRLEQGYKEGYLVDLISLPGRFDVADALISNACEHFDSLDVNAINFKIVEGHPYQSLASRHGFTILPGSTPMNIMLSLSGLENEYTALQSTPPERVHFTYGDYW